MDRSTYLQKRFGRSQALINFREQGLVQEFLGQTGPPQRILDLPCGFGRFTPRGAGAVAGADSVVAAPSLWVGSDAASGTFVAADGELTAGMSRMAWQRGQRPCLPAHSSPSLNRVPHLHLTSTIRIDPALIVVQQHDEQVLRTPVVCDKREFRNLGHRVDGQIIGRGASFWVINDRRLPHPHASAN